MVISYFRNNPRTFPKTYEDGRDPALSPLHFQSERLWLTVIWYRDMLSRTATDGRAIGSLDKLTERFASKGIERPEFRYFSKGDFDTFAEEYISLVLRLRISSRVFNLSLFQEDFEGTREHFNLEFSRLNPLKSLLNEHFREVAGLPYYKSQISYLRGKELSSELVSRVFSLATLRDELWEKWTYEKFSLYTTLADELIAVDAYADFISAASEVRDNSGPLQERAKVTELRDELDILALWQGKTKESS